jgi:transglutaminase-like putative cysteine protease
VSGSGGGRLTSRIVATLGLMLYSGAVAYGFVRVFFDGSFAGDLVAIVIVVHGLSLLLRGVHIAVALPVQVLVTVLLVGVLCHPDTLASGLPTGATWTAIGDDIAFAREEFRTAVAPVNYDEGWSTLAVISLALAVLLADVFAFRARTRFEALVPGGVLFVVVGALGTGEDQVVTAMLIVLAGVIAVACLRAHQVRPPRTLVGHSAPPLARLAMGAVPLGVVAALIGGALGPSLPGSGSEPLYEPLSGGGVTRIGSPLVDIRSRLVNQSDEVLFLVTSPLEAYWRLTTLAEFDGRSWRLPERSLVATDDSLGAAVEGSVEIAHTVEIASLGGRLVPAAAEPIRARGPGLRWSAEAATLLAGSNGYERGDVFRIVSAAPRFEAEQLAATSASNAPSETYVELPDDFPEAASQLATEITAGARSDYERALLLQNWFRAEFDYSTEIEEGHGNSAIEDFLERRSGYCEQFAGTYAAMARWLGMPSRVAVGYTPGQRDDGGAYAVAGRNAHAWPEVWFDGLGWVPFEPTPGRGAPGAEEYTGVARDQEGPSVGEPAPTTTVAVGDLPGAPVAPPPTDPRLGDGASRGSVPPVTAAVPASSSGGGFTTAMIVLGVLASLGLIAAIPALVRRHRRSRWRADPQTAVADIWARVQQLIAATGVGVDPAHTPTEFAITAARVVPGASTEIRSLAGMVNRTLYGPVDAIADDAGATSEAWYREIVRHTSLLLPMQQRVWRYVTLRD